MAKPYNHSLSDKLNAAMAYLITGNSIEASKLCGIPDKTIRNWSTEIWWSDLIGEAKKTKNEELDAMLTSIIHKVIVEIKDRVENGDEVLGKDGTKFRKKITAKDAAIVSAVLFDKRGIIRSEPTNKIKVGGEKTRLLELAQELEEVSGTTPPKTSKGKVNKEENVH